MIRWLLLAALLGAALQVNADDLSGSSDDGGANQGGQVPMVLTPARLRQPHSEVPGSVTVITRDMIEASGAREPWQVLRLVPGMSAGKSDGNIPSVSYHGTLATDSRRMLVLIDGRSVYHPGLARVTWNEFPLSVDDIERIEVTRGPDAASYGANAFSGVINIITRHPRDVIGTTVMDREGNDGVADRRVTHGSQWGSGAVRFTVETRHDNGYEQPYLYPGNGVLYQRRDAKWINLADMRSEFDVSDRDTLEFMAGGTRTYNQRMRDADFEQFGTYARDPYMKNNQAFLEFRWHRQVSPTHSFKFQTYAQHMQSNETSRLCMNPLPGYAPATGAIFFTKEMRDYFLAHRNESIDSVANNAFSDPAVQARLNTLQNSGAGPFCGNLTFDILEHRYDAEFQDTLYLADQIKLVTGLDLRHDRGRSETFVGGSAGNVSEGAFSTLEAHLAKPLILNLGGFWQRDQINGENFSPRLAVIYKLAPSQSLRYVYSESLRTIDIYEDQAYVALHAHDLPASYRANTGGLLGWNDARFFVLQQTPGNLRPERIRSREVGYYGNFSNLELDVRLFEEDLYDLISDALNPFNFVPTNNDHVRLHGWETEWNWRPWPSQLLRLTTAHIWDDWSINTESRFSPRDSGSFLWRYDVSSNWMLSASYYVAHDYNKWPYDLAEAKVVRHIKLGKARLDLTGMVSRTMHSRYPIIYQENRYADRDHYWLAANLTF